MGQEGVEVDCQTDHEGSKDDYMMANEGELFEQAVVEVGVAEEGDRRAEELREVVGDGAEGDELSSVQIHGEEEGNQTATNREVQGVEGGDEPQFGKEIEQQHSNGDIDQQSYCGADISPVQDSLAGLEEDDVRGGEVLEQESVAEVDGSKELKLALKVNINLSEDGAEVKKSDKNKSPFLGAGTGDVIDREENGVCAKRSEDGSSSGPNRITPRHPEQANPLLGNEASGLCFRETTSRKVSVSPTMDSISEVSVRGFKKSRAAARLGARGESAKKSGNQRGAREDPTEPNVVEPTGLGELHANVGEQNVPIEVYNEVGNQGGEDGGEEQGGVEDRVNDCDGFNVVSSTLDALRRDASSDQRLVQLEHDWSEEEHGSSEREGLGGAGDTFNKRGLKVLTGGRPEDQCAEKRQGSSNNKNARKMVGDAVRKSKKENSWRRNTNSSKENGLERRNKFGAGFAKSGVKQGMIVKNKKRLLGSKTTMLQDSPLMMDAPTFDTTLPAFEEAHNASKQLQKSFQEAHTVKPSYQEKSLQDFCDSVNDAALPVAQKTGNITQATKPNVAVKSKGKGIDTDSKTPNNSSASRKLANLTNAAVGRKRKSAAQINGTRRKAPRRTIKHLNFTNYDHLEIIPGRPEDVTHSFHNVSNISESSKPRRFFKKSPIPDDYKKTCANKTARLNWTRSSVKSAGAISKRSTVDVSAIASIILPQAPRARQVHQIDEDGAEEYAVTAPSLHKLDASTSTEQGFVMMDVDEFQQLLHLVAAGIGLAASTTRGSKAQVGFCLSHAFKTEIDSDESLNAYVI